MEKFKERKIIKLLKKSPEDGIKMAIDVYYWNGFIRTFWILCKFSKILNPKDIKSITINDEIEVMLP